MLYYLANLLSSKLIFYLPGDDDGEESFEPEYSAYLSDFGFSLLPYHGTKLLCPIAEPGRPSTNFKIYL